jgi:hypothetical protein
MEVNGNYSSDLVEKIEIIDIKSLLISLIIEPLPVGHNVQEILDLMKADRPFDLDVEEIIFYRTIKKPTRHLVDAIKRCKTLTHITVSFPVRQSHGAYWQPECWDLLVDAMLSNNYIVSFATYNILFSAVSKPFDSICKIIEGKSDPNDSLTRFNSNEPGRRSLQKIVVKGRYISFSRQKQIVETLRHDGQIRTLHLSLRHTAKDEDIAAVLAMLGDNDTLSKFSWQWVILTEAQGFVEFIQQNRSITKLGFDAHIFSEDYWKLIEAALRKNKTIHEFKFDYFSAYNNDRFVKDIPQAIKVVLGENKIAVKQAESNTKMLVEILALKPRAYFEIFPREIWLEILKHIRLPGLDPISYFQLLRKLNK